MTEPRNLDFSPFNLPHDALQALGLITSSAAHTEHIIEEGIGGCLGIDYEYSFAVTSHMASPLRDQVLRAAAEIRIDDLDDLDTLDELMNEIMDSLKLRNKYVHNSLARDIDTGELLATSIEARGSVQVDLIPVTVNQIKEDATRIYAAGMKLMQFLLDRNLLPIFPTQERPRAHKLKAARKARRKAMRKEA